MGSRLISFLRAYREPTVEGFRMGCA